MVHDVLHDYTICLFFQLLFIIVILYFLSLVLNNSQVKREPYNHSKLEYSGMHPVGRQ